MSRIIRVPLYLSSRCGVWKSICSPDDMPRSINAEQRGHFVAGALVQADLADAQARGPLEELGQQGDDLAGEADVFGLLGVDAHPGSSAGCRGWPHRRGSHSVNWRK